MAYCSECGNLYDITNIPPDVANSSSEEQSVTKGGSKTLTNTKGPKMYFSCSTCGNSEVIKPHTHIIGRQSVDNAKTYNSTTIRPENLINVPVLVHTRDYKCPNPSCATNSKPETRDAVMNRVGNTFKIQYTCTVCLTNWA